MRLGKSFLGTWTNRAPKVSGSSVLLENGEGQYNWSGEDKRLERESRALSALFRIFVSLCSKSIGTIGGF